MKPLQDRWGTTVEVKKLGREKAVNLKEEAARCARSEQRAAKKAAESFAAMLPCILCDLFGEHQTNEKPEQ